jgi:uncharacterized repeat protein (TIGR03803 family)
VDFSLPDHVKPGFISLVVVSVLLAAAAIPLASGRTETVLYSFANSPDGAYPFYGALVLGKKRNLYGTTVDGGAYTCLFGNGCGAVFKVTPSGAETVVYNFGASGDGSHPIAGLVKDKYGNFYGTTETGGEPGCFMGSGCGTVFEFTSSGTETILHSFDPSGTDGSEPLAGLVLDKEGNLYGTTYIGGAYNYGTVFKLTPSGTETILHSFDANGIDGYGAAAGVVLDAKGNLYGTTQSGGTYGLGTVYKLTPSGTETILHSFGASGDGYDPYASGLIRDKKGNLYGTTLYGGANDCNGNGCGTVFELSPPARKNGVWTEMILHSFNADGTDGYDPYASLIMDKEGILYGTTGAGGTYGSGTVFELSSSGTETILHSFDANGTDGGAPESGLVLDTKGNLYGTTSSGGSQCSPFGCGTVFQITPQKAEARTKELIQPGLSTQDGRR